MMRKLLLALTIGLIAMGCKDREPNPNVLPPATQEGKNTAGCLVDGKVLVFSDNIRGYEQSSMYRELATEFYLYLHMTPVNKGGLGFDVHLTSDGKLETNKKYILGKSSTSIYDVFPVNNMFISYNDVLYGTDDNHKAEIVFTALNKHKQFVSGTFSGKLVSKTGKVITVTKGRFDIQYSIG